MPCKIGGGQSGFSATSETPGRGVSKREIGKSEEDFLHLAAWFRLVVDERQMVLLLTGLLSKVLFKLWRMRQARNIP